MAAELYLEGGVRSVEIGTLMFAAAAPMDLVRLAIPRRVYTQSHIDYLVEIIIEIWKNREKIRGLRRDIARVKTIARERELAAAGGTEKK